MNKVILMGRLTADPEVRTLPGGEHTIAYYTLAVDRKVARNNGQTTADFIRISAWDKKADFAERYLKKGSKILVTGRIQTGSYTDKDGKKVYTEEVIAEDQEFCEAKKSGSNAEVNDNPPADADGFMNIPEGIDEDLPFAPSR